MSHQEVTKVNTTILKNKKTKNKNKLSKSKNKIPKTNVCILYIIYKYSEMPFGSFLPIKKPQAKTLWLVGGAGIRSETLEKRWFLVSIAYWKANFLRDTGIEIHNLTSLENQKTMFFFPYLHL